jgi:hypothetical protein
MCTGVEISEVQVLVVHDSHPGHLFFSWATTTENPSRLNDRSSNLITSRHRTTRFAYAQVQHLSLNTDSMEITSAIWHVGATRRGVTGLAPCLC